MKTRHAVIRWPAMIKVPMVRGSAFHPLCRLMEDAGVDSARLLHSSGISPAFAGTRLPREEAVPSRLFTDFIDRAQRACGIEDFGLEAGSRTSILSIGDLGNVLARSFTVHALIQKFAALMPLINSGSESWLEPGRKPGSLRFCHRQVLKTGHAQVDGYAIPIFIDAVRMGAGPDWRPRWISLNKNAGNQETREMLSDAETQADADYFAFEIPKSILCRKLPFAERRPGGKTAESRLLANAPPEDLPGALSQSIRTGFGVRIPTVTQASDIAGTSPRTLQRALRAEHDVSYRDIVEQTRIREALFFLAKPDLRLEEISRYLCYSDHANFTHAFRRWTGRVPSDYRQTAGERK